MKRNWKIILRSLKENAQYAQRLKHAHGFGETICNNMEDDCTSLQNAVLRTWKLATQPAKEKS